MALAVSPLAPAHFPDLPALEGVRLAALACGIKYKDRPDVLLAECAQGTVSAGVFTRSLTASAPVEWCRKVRDGKSGRVLLVNSGNSNAFTGRAGVASLERSVNAAASALGCSSGEIYVASTGVIGVPLPDEKITEKLPEAVSKLRADAWDEAARAIMTTDTFPKCATRSAMIDGVKVTINGIAKGSGMIAPDMATMLAFVFTDAAIAEPLLQQMLEQATCRSFNAITVDGDTSTSDTLLLFATGKAGNKPLTESSAPGARAFYAALESLLIELAQWVVKDGEGASKFITIAVHGAEHDEAARRIGLAIANSPLVKTAIAGEDANWGRIVMAVGKSGERADRDRLAITIGGIRVAENGEVCSSYSEAELVPHMKGQHIDIAVEVGVGSGSATVWTCDLTHGYISINADYRS